MEVRQFLNYIVITIVTNTKGPQIHLHFVQPHTALLKYNLRTEGLQFGGPLKWPGNVSMDVNGVVKFEFEKQIPHMWEYSYIPVLNVYQSIDVPKMWTVTVTQNEYISRDTAIITVRHVDNVFNTYSCGKWIHAEAHVSNELKRRYYFVVPKLPLKSLTDPNPGCDMTYSTDTEVSFMVKSIRDEGLNVWLINRLPGSVFAISNEDGKFDFNLVANRTIMYFIAGGVGIAPSTSIALRILQGTNTTKIHIIYFCYDQRRLLFCKYFEQLKQFDSRFNITYIVKKIEPGWTGHVGFVEQPFLEGCGVPYFRDVGYNAFFAISGAFHFVLKTKKSQFQNINNITNNMDLADFCGYMIFTVATQGRTNIPQIHAEFLTNTTCRVRFNWYKSVIKFAGKIVWPLKIAIYANGTIQFRIDKVRPGEWKFPAESILGRKEYLSAEIPDTQPTYVVSNKELNHNTNLLTLKYKNRVFNYISVCSQFSIQQDIHGELREALFTPVPLLPWITLDDPNPAPGTWFPVDHNLRFLIKRRQNDTLLNWLYKRHEGDEVNITNPMGTFNDRVLKNTTDFHFFAGGTGIAPLLTLGLWILQTNRVANVKIYFFNIDEKDIFWKQELDDTAKAITRFSIEYILSRPKTVEWSDKREHVSLDMIKHWIEPRKHDTYVDKFFATSAHLNFSTRIKSYLVDELGYPSANVYSFDRQKVLKS